MKIEMDTVKCCIATSFLMLIILHLLGTPSASGGQGVYNSSSQEICPRDASFTLPVIVAGSSFMDSTDFSQWLFVIHSSVWDLYSSEAELLLGFLSGLLIIHFHRHSMAKRKRKQDTVKNIFTRELFESSTERIALENECQEMTPEDEPEEMKAEDGTEKMITEDGPKEMTLKHEPEEIRPELGHGPEEITLLGDKEIYDVMILGENHEDVDEAELKDWDRACTKNPGHKGFYPAEQFCTKRDQLPTLLQHEVVFAYIQTIMRLTVGVEVSQPKQKGTAFVCDVEDLFSPAHNGFVLLSRKQVKVRTARHVVSNNDACQRTQCRVNFNVWPDKANCPILHGCRVEVDSKEDDSCLMVCETDVKTAKYLKTLLEDYNEKREALIKMLNDSTDDIPVHAVCVSHPHGLAKHITVGKYLGDVQGRPFSWTYDTPTCPGSSGAPVCLIGKENGYIYSGNINIHWRGDRDLNRNVSGEGWRSY